MGSDGQYRKEFFARVENLVEVDGFLLETLVSLGICDDGIAYNFRLAVDEACTNIIKHAYTNEEAGRFAVECSLVVDEEGRQALLVTITDWGRPFDPGQVDLPDTAAALEDRKAGGLGLLLMNKVMDRIKYDFDDVNGNTLSLTKYIDGQITDG